MIDRHDTLLHGAQSVLMGCFAWIIANAPPADTLYHYVMETAAFVLIMMQIMISYRHLAGKSHVAPELPEDRK